MPFSTATAAGFTGTRIPARIGTGRARIGRDPSKNTRTTIHTITMTTTITTTNMPITSVGMDTATAS